MLLLPAVLVVLLLSIFPLIVSLYLSLSRFQLGKGGFSFDFIGLLNYRKLLFGSAAVPLPRHARAALAAGWLLLALVGAAAALGLVG